MPLPPLTPPNVLNYFLGKGLVSTGPAGCNAPILAGGSNNPSLLAEMGNCPKFGTTPKPEIIKHYSSMAGTKVLDYVAIKSMEGEVSLDVEEFTPDNLVLALVGELNSSGQIELFAAPGIYRAVRLVGTNAVGAQVQVDLYNVFFASDKTIELIDDNWGSIPLVGQVLRLGSPQSGAFGTLTFLT